MPEESPLTLAEKRLAAAAMALGLNPQSAAVSAFVQGVLLNTRVDALIEYTAPFELDEGGSPIMKGTFEEVLMRHMVKRADAFEKAAQTPKILAPNGAMLNG